MFSFLAVGYIWTKFVNLTQWELIIEKEMTPQMKADWRKQVWDEARQTRVARKSGFFFFS